MSCVTEVIGEGKNRPDQLAAASDITQGMQDYNY